MSNSIKRKSKVGKEGNVWVYVALMAFPVLQFLIFYVLVSLNSFKLAFHEYKGPVFRLEDSWGFDNFKKGIEFLSGDGLSFIKVSLIGYFTHLCIGVPLGLLFSFYIYKKKFMSGTFRVLLFVPSIVPATIMVAIYSQFCDSVLTDAIRGVFNLDISEFDDLTKNADTRLYVVLFYNVFVSFGTSVLMYSNKMTSIDPSISEAAMLDGASQLQEFWHVTLPMSYSTISVFMVTSVALIFTNQLNVLSFYGWSNVGFPNDVKSLGAYFWLETSTATTAWDERAMARLSALGLIMSCIAIPITFTVRYLLNKFGPSEE